MRVDAVMSRAGTESEGASEVKSLESRLLPGSEGSMDSKRPDPAIDVLIQQLMAMEGQGEKAIYEFLRSLRSEDGGGPAYPSAKALLEVTLQVLVRLKNDGLEKSQLYKEVKGANGLAFGMDLFVKSYMRDVFQPMEDDAWEKSEW